MFRTVKAFSSFSVDDLRNARAFYGDKLGLQITEMKEGLQLEISGGGSIFIYPKRDHTPASFTILNFPVDDVEETVDKLTSAGIHFEQYDQPEIKTDEKGISRGAEGPTIAWFKDPAGNIMSVLEAD